MKNFIYLFILCLSWSGWTQDVSFEKAKLKIGKTIVHARIADTEERRGRGLMFVNSLPADDGMLFIFEEERPLTFWMKNTLIPLSIGFFDGHGRLIDVQEMKPAASLMIKDPPIYASGGSALFALEMNAGWFARRHVTKGARLSLVGSAKSALLKEKLASSRPSSGSSGSSAP